MPRADYSSDSVGLTDVEQAHHRGLSFADNPTGIGPALKGLDVGEQLRVFDTAGFEASDNSLMPLGERRDLAVVKATAFGRRFGRGSLSLSDLLGRLSINHALRSESFGNGVGDHLLELSLEDLCVGHLQTP